MMKKMKYTLILLLAPFLVSSDLPEEYLNDLKKMKLAFNQDEFSMNLTYSVYDRSNGKLLDRTAGTYSSAGSNYYYSTSNISIVQNKEWNMYIDEDEKLIVVKETFDQPESDLINFEAATKGCSDIERAETHDQFVYTVKFNDPVSNIYDDVKIFANKTTLFPKKVVFDYAYESDYTQNGESSSEKIRFEIRYENYKKRSTSKYSTDEFFSIDSDKIILTEKYEDFRLLDQRLSRITQN